MAQFWEELIQLNNENKLDKRFAGTILFTRLRPMFELFELEKDPGEFVNLSGKEDYREIEHRMKAARHRWMIIYRDVVPLPIPPPNWQHPEELTEGDFTEQCNQTGLIVNSLKDLVPLQTKLH